MPTSLSCKLNIQLGETKLYIFPAFTDRGTVQKVIVLPKDPTTIEELTLEEVEVFRVMKSTASVMQINTTGLVRMYHLFYLLLFLQTPVAVKTMRISAKRVKRIKVAI